MAKVELVDTVRRIMTQHGTNHDPAWYDCVTQIIAEALAKCPVEFSRISPLEELGGMRELDTVRSLLRAFRARLGEPQHRVEWLANNLGYPISTIYCWENGDPSKGLPSRSTILRIGQLYSLDCDEVNTLILACGAERKRPAQKAQYVPLSKDETKAWSPPLGPSSSTICVWQDRLHTAQAAYLAGELQSARRLAESILQQILAIVERDFKAGPWGSDDRDEIPRLWILAWREYFQSCAMLETAATLVPTCQPYVAWARKMAADVRDPHLRALVLHLEGDYYHNQALHVRALGYHLQALHELRSAEKDSALAAMIQRLVVLDGMHVLPRDEVLGHVQRARRMAERLDPGSSIARILVSEAAGRALGILGHPDCWSVLSDAETEARQGFPVGYITVLYSRMLALGASAGDGDLDQLRLSGTHALLLATYSKWERRVDQITRVATAKGIELCLM